MINLDILADFKRKMFAVADLLGWQASTDPEWYSVDIKRPDGATIHCFLPSDGKGRFEVTGRYIQDYHSQFEKTPKIRISVTKSTSTIANEIEQRFLAEYLPIYEREWQELQEWEDYQRNLLSQAEDLAAGTGGDVSQDDHTTCITYEWGRAIVYRDYVRFDIPAVSYETAKKFLRSLAANEDNQV
jgi:hypothetical protein